MLPQAAAGQHLLGVPRFFVLMLTSDQFSFELLEESWNLHELRRRLPAVELQPSVPCGHDVVSDATTQQEVIVSDDHPRCSHSKLEKPIPTEVGAMVTVPLALARLYYRGTEGHRGDHYMFVEWRSMTLHSELVRGMAVWRASRHEATATTHY